MHSPIQLHNIALSFPHKLCFEELTTQIHYGSRIAIIGNNGCGKSTLLNIIQGNNPLASGDINIPRNVCFGYVPQMIENNLENLSGAQRFNKALTQALSLQPNVLLLDEPTNHLDSHNRKSFFRMLKAFSGTLVIATHDIALLNNCVDTLWYIDAGYVHIFSGNYHDLMQEINIKRHYLEKTKGQLNQQKKALHQALMKEQVRAAKSRTKGEKSIEKRKWPTIVSKAKVNRALTTTAQKKSHLAQERQVVDAQLSALHLPDVLNPQFNLPSLKGNGFTLVSISQGSIGYNKQTLLSNITFSIREGQRFAIKGDNASGKSTLVKAILNNASVAKSGIWHTPKCKDIGYLDQHYNTLNVNQTVLESIQMRVPLWSHTQIRNHLCDFLFRKNEEVNALVSTLSGGEKARLSLAHIAAKTPTLLILDEITNNLDLITKNHVIQILLNYPGAMIVISHDEDFLSKINLCEIYYIENQCLVQTNF